jgi:hypothetical protein
MACYSSFTLKQEGKVNVSGMACRNFSSVLSYTAPVGGYRVIIAHLSGAFEQAAKEMLLYSRPNLAQKVPLSINGA